MSLQKRERTCASCIFFLKAKHRILDSHSGVLTMNKCVLFCLALFCGLLVEIKSQPRPVSPRSSIIKPNKRPTTTHTPKPTPPVPEDGDAAADDNIGEVILVNTNLVTIPVRILDRKNRFIGGLAKENFKVFEDGVEQEIDYFTNEAQPFTVALVLDRVIPRRSR